MKGPSERNEKPVPNHSGISIEASKCRVPSPRHVCYSEVTVESFDLCHFAKNHSATTWSRFIYQHLYL